MARCPLRHPLSSIFHPRFLLRGGMAVADGGHGGVPMATVHTYEESSSTPTDRVDGSENQAPAAGAYTDSSGLAESKSGPGNWGVAARWFMLALLAVAFFVCLYLLRR